MYVCDVCICTFVCACVCLCMRTRVCDNDTHSNSDVFFLEQYLGMLQWNLEDKDKIVSVLLINLKPSAFEGQIPCLPAHLLFMCLRYADHVKNEHQLTVLLEGIVKGIQQVRLFIFLYGCDHYVCITQVVQKNVNNIDALSFWLANVCRLFHNLKQYSVDEVCNTGLHTYSHIWHKSIYTYTSLFIMNML